MRIRHSRPKETEGPQMTRRELIIRGGGTIAAGLGTPFLLSRRAAASIDPVLTEAWAHVLPLAEGAWAVISTLETGDMTTLCNGGIIAGRDRVLVVEAFARRTGSSWVSDVALELTGRRPTDVVLTHYHGDHTGGLTGFARDGETIELHATAETLSRVRSQRAQGESPEAVETRKLIDAATVLGEEAPKELDLGGRSVELHPHRGHTASDVTVEVAEHNLAFGGDLLWNRMIPNFVDARPIELARTLERLEARGHTTHVPGHGPMADDGILQANILLTDALEAAGRSSFEAGTDAATAAGQLQLPGDMAQWKMFSDNYIERALSAWHRDLAAMDDEG